MRAKLLSRLKKLEARREAEVGLIVRLGRLRPLPSEFTGSRHVVIVKRELTGPDGAEWCEAEERPGPAPSGHDRTLTIFISEDDLNL